VQLIGTTVERIVGIDINPTYVAAAQARFGTQLPKLALYVADIQDALPKTVRVCGSGRSNCNDLPTRPA
jgi:hypothetical protein